MKGRLVSNSTNTRGYGYRPIRIHTKRGEGIFRIAQEASLLTHFREILQALFTSDTATTL